MGKIKIILGASILLLSSVQVNAAPIFMGLGDLFGGGFASLGPSVSADGSVVSGYSTDSFGGSGSSGAYRWTLADSMSSLESPPGATIESRGNGISGDGSIIVGKFRLPTTPTMELFQAFRWTNVDGMVGLGVLTGRDTSNANAISADGTVIVGRSSVNSAPVNVEAFRWTDTGGMVGLGDLSGGDFFSVANGVSGDGSIIVGQSKSSDNFEAFRWTDTDGMVGLGTIVDGDFYSIAHDVSADGSAIAGWGSVEGDTVRAFRWTETDGMVGLDRLAGRDDRGFGISADGSFVVGASDGQAVMWNSSNDVRTIVDILTNDFSLDLTGWDLWNTWDISDDLTTIVGEGENPDGFHEAWIAHLDGSFSDVSFPSTPDGPPSHSPVPEPPAILLFVTGILGLVFARRKRTQS